MSGHDALGCAVDDIASAVAVSASPTATSRVLTAACSVVTNDMTSSILSVDWAPGSISTTQPYETLSGLASISLRCATTHFVQCRQWLPHRSARLRDGNGTEARRQKMLWKLSA